MKQLLLSVLIGMAAGALNAAETDAKTEVKNAAKTLGNKTDYSWTAMPKSEGAGANSRSGALEGKTEKDGFTFFSMTVGNNEIEAAFKGSKSAIRIESEWLSSDELDGDRAWVAARLKAYKAPVAEAADLVAKSKELKKSSDGLLEGDLTEEGAKELISGLRQGGQSAEPKATKGSVKFWVKDGLLVKYEYNLQGKIIGRDDQEIELNRTTTVEIKDVGSTKVSVPEQAKKKLS